MIELNRYIFDENVNFLAVIKILKVTRYSTHEFLKFFIVGWNNIGLKVHTENDYWSLKFEGIDYLIL